MKFLNPTHLTLVTYSIKTINKLIFFLIGKSDFSLLDIGIYIIYLIIKFGYLVVNELIILNLWN